MEKKVKHYNLIFTLQLVSKAYSLPSKIAGKCYVTSEGKKQLSQLNYGLIFSASYFKNLHFPILQPLYKSKGFLFFTLALIIGPLNIPLPQGALSRTGRLLQN